MNEKIDQQDAVQTKAQQPVQPTQIGEAVSAGAVSGAVAGFASHHLAGGKMTFPIFIFAYIFILGGLKGRSKLLGLIVFTAVASCVMVALRHLGIR